MLSKTDMAYEVSKEEESLRKGPWLEEEDEMLINAVALLGERRWDALAKESGLRRSGKSCRLRWLNYLRPNLKHGEITEEEELVIIQLHQQWGNKWAKIARRLPGRTDNEIKNYWRTHLRKKILQAQEQDDYDSAIREAKLDPSVPFYGDFMYGKDCTSRASDDSSCALNELSNASFGSLTYTDDRVSDWASSCWSYDHQSEAKQYQSQSNDQSLDSTYSCLCYPTWSFEEESDSSIWDCSSSFWS